MTLLNDATLQRINDAVKATTDTFLKLETQILVRKENLEVFPQGDSQYTTYEISGMRVAEKEKAQFDTKGAFDDLGSYILYNYGDMQTAGIVDAEGIVNVKPNRDVLIAEGIEYKITGVLESGYLVNKYSVVKIFIEKKL